MLIGRYALLHALVGVEARMGEKMCMREGVWTIG